MDSTLTTPCSVTKHGLAALAIALCCGLSAPAQANPPRKVVITCPADRPPIMDDIRRAIEHSDYTVTLHARLQMLARSKEHCAIRPAETLTFVSPEEMKNVPDTAIAVDFSK